MDSEDSRTPGQAPARAKQTSGAGRSRKGRTVVYTGLLLFSIIACTVMLGVPSVRGRLVARATALQAAISGSRGPVTAELGDVPPPMPGEYERPEYRFPDAGQTLPEDWVFTVPPGRAAERPQAGSALMTPRTAEDDRASAAGVSEGTAAGRGSETTGAVIEYTAGEAERRAYGLLLEAKPHVGAMVDEGAPSRRFRSWGGAPRGGDVYWVRLVFETGEGLEVEYIWQVDLQAKEVLPLSHNARTLP